MASTTSTSDSNFLSLLEFETFSDVVGEIPEVDCRGKVNRSFMFSASTDDSKSNKTEDGQASPRSEKNANFLKSLLTPRSPYQEFHRLFKNVPRDQIPINAFSCALSREILLQGRMYVSQGWFCFYSNIFGWENQVTIDCSTIKAITRQKTAYVVPNAILICVGDEKYFFSSFLQRETVFKLLYRVWNESRRQAGLPDKFVEDILVEPLNGSIISGPLEESIINGDQVLAEPCNLDVDDVEGCDLPPSCPICGFMPGEIADTACAECGLLPGPGEFQLMDIPNLLSEEQRSVLADPLLCTEQEQIDTRPTNSGDTTLLSTTVSKWRKTFIKLIKSSKKDYFSILLSVLVLILFLMSTFLMYRISVLEPKILFFQNSRTSGYASPKQMWMFREELFQAQLTRFRYSLAANVDAVSQVRDALHLIQQDLGVNIQDCGTVNSSHC